MSFAQTFDATHRNGGVARRASTSVRLKHDPHAGPEPASLPNAWWLMAAVGKSEAPAEHPQATRAPLPAPMV